MSFADFCALDDAVDVARIDAVNADATLGSTMGISAGGGSDVATAAARAATLAAWIARGRMSMIALAAAAVGGAFLSWVMAAAAACPSARAPAAFAMAASASRCSAVAALTMERSMIADSTLRFSVRVIGGGAGGPPASLSWAGLFSLSGALGASFFSTREVSASTAYVQAIDVLCIFKLRPSTLCIVEAGR